MLHVNIRQDIMGAYPMRIKELVLGFRSLRVSTYLETGA